MLDLNNTIKVKNNLILVPLITKTTKHLTDKPAISGSVAAAIIGIGQTLLKP